MDQMNVSITDELAGYVRRKVKTGRFNNASEVVRDALRRMEEEEAREIRLACPAAEDVIANLTEQEIASIRSRVLASMDAVGQGEFTEYEGREGLRKLATGVKARGRRLLKRE